MKAIYRYSIVLFFIFLMVFAAVWFGEREIIFPELAAVSTGLLIIDKRVWAVSSVSAFILLTLMSVVGSVISLYSPLPLYANMTIGVIITLLSLRIARSNFYPILSASVLPILMHEGGLLYIIVTVCGGGLILLAREFEFSTGLRKKDSPLVLTDYNRNLFIAFGPRVILIGLIIFLFYKLDFYYAMLPPLIVAFVELSFNKSGMRRGAAVVLFLLLSAIALGACAVYVSYTAGIVPIYVSICIAEVCLFCIFELAHRKFAPASAMVLVPALANPANPVFFASDAAVGAVVFVLSALSLSAAEQRMNIKARYN